MLVEAEALGEGNVKPQDVMQMLGQELTALGFVDEAESLLKRALALVGKGSERAAALYGTLANLSFTQKRPADAVAHCKAGLACRGSDERTRNVLLITLANVQEVAGDYVSAAAARSELLRVKGAPQTSTCTVCMEDIQPAKPSTRGGANPAATALEVQQCRHITHRSCMDIWAEQQKRLGSRSLSCPTCRGVAGRGAGRTGPSDAVPAPAGAPHPPPLALSVA